MYWKYLSTMCMTRELQIKAVPFSSDTALRLMGQEQPDIGFRSAIHGFVRTRCMLSHHGMRPVIGHTCNQQRGAEAASAEGFPPTGLSWEYCWEGDGSDACTNWVAIGGAPSSVALSPAVRRGFTGPRTCIRTVRNRIRVFGPRLSFTFGGGFRFIPQGH